MDKATKDKIKRFLKKRAPLWVFLTLATIIFFVILTLLLISNTIDTDSDKKGSGK